MRMTFFGAIVYFMTGIAWGAANAPPSRQETVLADQIWVVKVTDVVWKKPDPKGPLQPTASGHLSVTVATVLRGDKKAAGTSHQLNIWMTRKQADALGLVRQSAGSPWGYLPLKKDARLILFFAKGLQWTRYDLWQSSIGDEKIIDAEPYTEGLVRDLALIDQCLQAKDVGAAVWKVLQNPKGVGEGVGAFAGETLFKRRLGTDEIRKKVIQLADDNGLSLSARMRVVAYIEEYISSSRLQPLPADQVQPLVDLLVHGLLNPKLEKHWQGLASSLYKLLVAQKYADKVTIPKSDIGPLVKAVQLSVRYNVPKQEQMKVLTEVLEKKANGNRK